MIINLADVEQLSIKAESVDFQYDMYKKVCEKFTDFEQSVLWQCMEAKKNEALHRQLNKIVKKHLTKSPYQLYRGISKSTEELIKDLQVGEVFSTNRVDSFTTSLLTACSFSYAEYFTKIILRLKTNKAFNYSDHISDIILSSPNTEFKYTYEDTDGLDSERTDNLMMIVREQEWMIPIGKYRITSISKEKLHDSFGTFKVYDIEVVE
ncbi:NAD--protein ADP-ribosyltransferase [Serratia phage PhiZZ30]|uniref:NAD--protein ADP-ribosyltransferase modB n=1 Tax=Serratia phage PhiZZ30 TaxID=2716729 RepID=A0A6G8R8I0_9CAUD|nr:RNA polymerase ADP-ribosylase [Serratia phage PhiZZ30]QIN97692.1 NAD--protein ADP-ribosyltransferase [Serratia phage PhiZZ30]